jgi:hypothetical protein
MGWQRLHLLLLGLRRLLLPLVLLLQRLGLLVGRQPA